MTLKNKNLAFFFTKGISLKIWDDVGMLEREVAPYNLLAEKFNKIYFFTYGNKTELKYKKYLADDIEIVYKKSRLPDVIYQLVLPFKFRKILKDCDFLKTNQIDGSLSAAISKILYKKSKLIIRSGYIASLNAKFYKSSLFFRFYINIVEWFGYRICDKAFIPAKDNYDYLIKKYSFLKKKLITKNNSINTDIFKPLSVERKYDIGYVGRLNKDKNLISLLRAVKDLNLKLCFIGQGDEKQDLLDFTRGNNVNLTIIDRVNNYRLPFYYNSFKYYVFPSLHEGNPKTLLEAMGCGLPVVGCNVVGVNNLIVNNKTGLLSNINSDSLKNNILTLINDRKLQKRLGENARRFILENYSLDKLIKKEIKIYETL